LHFDFSGGDVIKLRFVLLSLLLTIVVSCKSNVDDFDVFFLDANGEVTELTSFEIRPYIVWQVVCADVLSTDIDMHAGFTQSDIMYNWMLVNPIIQNNSEYDIVLNKVTMKAMFYGEKGGASLGTVDIDSGCQFRAADSCQYCFPRTIPAGTSEDIAVNGDCIIHSGNDRSYKAGRVNLEIEMISEVYGKMTKTVTLFATPKDEFSPPPDDYGVLLTSDGESYCQAPAGWASTPTGWFSWSWWESSGTTIYNRAPPIAPASGTTDVYGGTGWSSTTCCSLDDG
jgi:hypothetical protein